jgi:hypothetical protein
MRLDGAFAWLRERLKQMARPAALAEGRGLVLQRLAQAAQQGGAAFQADQRVVGRDLEGKGFCESLEKTPAVKA